MNKILKQILFSPYSLPPSPNQISVKNEHLIFFNIFFFGGEEVVLLLYIHECRIPPRVLSSTQFNEFQHRANVEYHNVLLQRGS